MNILVLDGQGGKMGRQLIERISAAFPDYIITAVGTNSVATSTMIKGGAKYAATGENAVLAASRKADVIIGSVGIVIADSLVGEISPKMAAAVGQSDAFKILIPTNRCNNLVAGIGNQTMGELLDDVIKKLSALSG
ncbi:MAG TPA: DUF3842 family protein [Clostridiales bacterium]|jgi:prephenate dehydrogenase|nr:DUF3842 family protein [Clostridiales bacterium]